MAEMMASELLAKTTIGSVYTCNTGNAHVWGQWEFNTVPSSVKGVEHAYQARICQECGLTERLELGYIAAKDSNEQTPTTTGNNGPVVQFPKKGV